MSFAFQEWKLSPAEFWVITPRELAAAIGGLVGQLADGPLGRADLGALMAAFPDRS